MKAFLIAPGGMLGRAWEGLLKAEGIEYAVGRRPEFDLTRPESIDLHGADVVINCAAYTDVDGAENDEAGANAVNGDGVKALAEQCAKTGALLVHYSTDYVFRGQASAPYPCDAPRAPLNAYGRSKALGEEAIEASGCKHLIVRTSWLYAPWGKNFVLTMRSLGKSRDKLSVVDDQRGRPTSCRHLAKTTLAMLRQGASGMHHITDGGECTWYDLASHVVAQSNPNCEVSPCSSDAFPRPAPRPSYSVLDLSRTEALVGAMPAWQDNVDAALRDAE